MSIKTKIAEELASRVKGGDSLAMDFASRMQRAKEQGFDTEQVYYHGTNADFDEFRVNDDGVNLVGKGVYAAPAGTASGYASDVGSSVYPLLVKGKKASFQDAADARESIGDGWTNDSVNDWLKERGFSHRDGRQGIVIFDHEKNIRSTNAAFDPAKKDSSNLLAEMGAGIAATSTLPWMAKRAEAAEQERISAQIDESIANMNRGQTIEAPINPYYQTAADAVAKYNRAIKGSPAEYLLGAEGLEDYLRHGAYGEADMFDRGSAALNIAELFAAPAEGLKYLGKITN